MSQMIRIGAVITAFVATFAIAERASADAISPCPTDTTLADVSGKTCSIGSLIFAFGEPNGEMLGGTLPGQPGNPFYVPTNVDASSISFDTVVTSVTSDRFVNGTGMGFRIGFSVPIPDGEYNIPYTVTLDPLIDPAARNGIVGATVSLTGSVSPVSDFQSSSSVQTGLLLCNALEDDCVDAGTGLDTVGTLSTESDAERLPFGFIPPGETSALHTSPGGPWTSFVACSQPFTNPGTCQVASTEHLIVVEPGQQVPEPASSELLVFGLFALLARRRPAR